MLVKIENNENKFKFFNEIGKDITHQVVKQLGFRNIPVMNVIGGLLMIEILKNGYFESHLEEDQIRKLLVVNGFQVA